MSEKITIPYANYKEMNQEFYTINETCGFINIDKKLLKETCRELSIDPIQNEIGDYGFPKYHVRKLHNHLFKKFYGKNNPNKKDDPWA